MQKKNYHFIDLLDKDGRKISFPVAVNSSIILLEDFQNFIKEEEAIEDLEESVEVLSLEIQLAEEGEDSSVDLVKDSDSLNLQLAELFLKVTEARKRQIRAVTPPKYYEILDRVADSQYPLITASLRLDLTEVKPEVYFNFLPGVQPEINYYKEVLKNKVDRPKPLRRIEIRRRLKLLKQGRLLAIPVAEGVLESRIVTDTMRQKWSELPNKLKATMKEKKIEFDQLRDTLAKLPATTPEQRREKLKREQLLSSYLVKTDNEIWQDAHRLLAHTVVPIHEEYRYALAQQRAESFKKLPLDIARSLLLFFLEARKRSTLNMLMYSVNAVTQETIR